MLWVRRPLIFFALALVLINAQCVTACTASRCDRSQIAQSKDSVNLPPCHRHHPSQETDASKHCSDSVALMGARASAPAPASGSGAAFAAIIQTTHYDAILLLGVNRTETASPPIFSGRPSTTVLRV